VTLQIENLMTDEKSKLSGGASVFDRVQDVLGKIRPAVQSDGGDLELVEVTQQGVAKIRLHGACVGCPSSTMTLQMGIERNIREKVPEVIAVEQVH
jgi:Fe-S cluster biogenesis protein NfuA